MKKSFKIRRKIFDSQVPQTTCVTVSKPVTSEECTTVEKEECENVPKEVTITVDKEVCEDVPKQECKDVTGLATNSIFPVVPFCKTKSLTCRDRQINDPLSWRTFFSFVPSSNSLTSVTDA